MRSPFQPRGRSPFATVAIPTTLLVSIGLLIQPILANPFPKDAIHNILGFGFLQDSHCASYCGQENEHCCSKNEVCTTADNNVAGCGSTATLAPVELFARDPVAGTWSVWTTTWTETETFTSTYSSYWGSATETAGSGGGGTCTPPAGSGEIACGSICCASWQYCAYEGQCLSNAGATAPATATVTTAGETTAWSTYSTTMTTAGSTITTQFSAPYRVTGTESTTTNTGTLESATTTSSGNGTAVSTTSGSNLSGGAIAGIVIGVLAGVALLLLLCFCCIMRGLWHGLLALLGFGPKKRRSRSHERETVIVEEERFSRRGSSHARRDTHGGWFAARPPRSAAAESRRASEKQRESGTQASWWGAGALGTLLLLLGLRRDKKRRQSTVTKRTSRPRSAVSSSYFSDSYTASSPSEFSSDYTYSSVYTPAQSAHHPPAPPRGGPRTASVVRSARSPSVRSAGRFRDEYDLPPKSNYPPDYAGSASSGGRTRDTRRSRRTETTRMSRAPSRR